MRGTQHEHSGERVAVHVEVVGQHAGGGEREPGVLVQGIDIIGRNRRVGQGMDGDGHRAGEAVGGAVVGGVGEGIQAVVILGGRIGEATGGLQAEGAMRRAAYEDGG